MGGKGEVTGPESARRRLSCIMFTDMVGYSAVSQRDERLALELVAEQRVLLRPIFAEHGGREVKSTGDGFLVEFASAPEAARCAVELQQAVAARNAEAPRDRRFQIRIGLHLGDIEVQEGSAVRFSTVVGDLLLFVEAMSPPAHGGP